MKQIAGILGVALVPVLIWGGLAGPAPAATEEPTPPDRDVTVSYAGCEGWGGYLAVPLGQVRPLVPPEFALRGEAAGLAQLGAVFVHCPTFAVENVSAPAMDYFVLFAELESPAGSYDLVEVSNSASWQGAMQIVDKASDLADDYSLTFERVTSSPLTADAAITIDGRTIRSTARFAANDVPGAPVPSYHWGKGRYGVVEAIHDNTLVGTGAAAITLDVSPGSPEARILGATSLALPGAFLGYSATAYFFAHG